MTEDNYDLLFDEWSLAKLRVKEAQDELLDIESEIFEKYKKDIKPEGTSSIGPMKIVTGYTSKWDQKKLDIAHAEYLKQKINLPFGFKSEWKPVARDLAPLVHTEFYKKHIADALTISPKKPSFKMTDSGEDEE